MGGMYSRMPTLLHTADVHLGHRQYGLQQRAADIELTFEHVLGRAEATDVDALLVPGDLFDSRDVRPRTLETVEALLEDVSVPVLVSPGNHDQNMSRRRRLTWLEYLNNRGLITLLSADLSGGRATFAPTSVDDPRRDGGGYVDLETDEGTIRVFGIQYRGAYMERQLPDIVEGINIVNESEGDPAGTVILGHFGIDDAVPDLGATLSYASLEPLADLADYIALGHIHKQYEADNVYNPGSLEAHDVQEARWEDAHGYYLVDTTDWSAEHRLAKRRPYYTLEFDVSEYRTFADLETAFRQEVREERSSVETVCKRSIHTKGSGGKRKPIVNLRLQGTLLLDFTSFDIERLREIVEDELGALYVQPTDKTERKAVDEILGDLERDDAFEADGTVNTEALQKKVFTTLAEESRYSEHPEEVASTLDDLERRVTEQGQGPNDVATYLQERRRELFPDGVGETNASKDLEEATGGGDD